ncbi:hypothetical protein HUJ04_001007 [Dendroctonus ponderosae]|nr:hypothetical protein HUJ04_001007 [Dendroctonus ponderosae]
MNNMSSDSSDDENLDLLREAVDHEFLNDSMFTEKPFNSQEKAENNPKPPSLRKTQDEDEQFNLFRVTPEFQQHVAKHLSQIIEDKLQKLTKIVENKDSVPTQKKRKAGVKLFSNSDKVLKVIKVNNLEKQCLPRARPLNLKRAYEPIDESALKEVAVSSEDILSQKETKSWSNRSKAPVYHYKQSSDGQLVLVEPQFQLNVPNLGPDIIGPPSNPKKRRKNNQSQPIQAPPNVQDLLPPTPSGYGDTIVASNPFDDCPSSVNSMGMNRGPQMGPMGGPMGMPPNMTCAMGMGRPPMGAVRIVRFPGMGPMGSPMMHSPNAMGNPMMSGGPRMGGHMGPGPGPHGGPHMLNSPNGHGPGGPMHPGMTGPPMHSPIGGMGSMQGPMGPGCGPMGGPMGGGPMNGPMNGGGPNNQMNGPMNGPINGPMSGPMNNPMNGPMNGPGPMGGPHGPGGPHGGPGGGMGHMNGPNGPIGPPMNNNNFMMSPMNAMYSKPMPVSAGKVYPADQPMVFNSQNPNAPPIYPCGICHKEVHDNDQAILCESGCNFWFHRGCTGLTEHAFQLLTAEVYAEWVCDKCLATKNIPLVKFKP